MADTWDLRPIDVARQLSITKETVVKWADAGTIPCFKLPNGWRRFRQEDVDSLLELGRVS
ncbi:MAG: helix-turn-helix domain-containing protein [Candidatus Eisenbacteria bacterium]|uniref:Helix-turn-helix domain-containing protein n=1 Tax=Eiseniibacteriota bacterium TaxID=2212470 RepID=A0A956M4X9_UNCEI|nr:helix-turn-helix domain-containing protein [Candidatus Eisenbacteria bacterium]